MSDTQTHDPYRFHCGDLHTQCTCASPTETARRTPTIHFSPSPFIFHPGRGQRWPRYSLSPTTTTTISPTDRRLVRPQLLHNTSQAGYLLQSRYGKGGEKPMPPSFFPVSPLFYKERQAGLVRLANLLRCIRGGGAHSVHA